MASRAAGVLWFLALAGIGSAGPVAAQGEIAFSVSPPSLELREAAGVVEVRVAGAPPSAGYQFEIGWDPGVLAVTAVAPGDFLSSAGGTVFTPRFLDEGRLVVGEVLEGAPPSGVQPSGEGALAYVTFAPLGTTGAAAVTLADANLVGPAGEGLPAAVTTGGEVTVAVTAPEAQQTAALAQATALATQLGVAPGAPAFEIPSMEDLPEPSSTGIWVGLLFLAALVVAAGWYVGRDPGGRRGDGTY